MDLTKLEIVSLPSEAGAGTRGSSLGPGALLASNQTKGLGLFEPYVWNKSWENNKAIGKQEHTPNGLNHLIVSEAIEKGNALCSSVIKREKEPLILSADHSNGAAGVSAFTDHYGVGESAVIWIDAHADLHTPYTTPSGNMHGMPLAALLGWDNPKVGTAEPNPKVIDSWEKIKKVGNGSSPKLLPQHLIFIAARDLEMEEKELIAKHNIICYGPEHIQEKGMESVLMEVEEYLKDIPHWYTSFDVDSLDTSISVGTGTPVKNGLTEEQAHTCFGYFFEHEKTKAFEITEINPTLDTVNKMANFVNQLLKSVLQ